MTQTSAGQRHALLTRRRGAAAAAAPDALADAQHELSDMRSERARREASGNIYGRLVVTCGPCRPAPCSRARHTEARRGSSARRVEERLSCVASTQRR